MFRTTPFYQSDEDIFCTPPDTTIDVKFQDYREPNEGTPKNVKPHLDRMEKGWIVSTGTERSFFDLLLSPEEKCEGLIIRDINPKVKAYCDFLILLLSYSNNREEFCALSEESSIESLKAILLPRLEKQASSKTAAYFRDHFDNLAQHYVKVSHMPKNGDNTGIDYRKDDKLFDKLQRFAKAGKILTTVGDINDLEFASGRKITVIDTSNISDYVPIRPRGYGDSTPRIIFTTQNPIETSYFSSLYEPVSEEEHTKIQKYMNLFKSSKDVTNFCVFHSMINSEKPDIFDKMPGNCFAKKNILKIKKILLSMTHNEDLRVIYKSFFNEAVYDALLKRFNGKKPETEIEITLDNLFNETEEITVERTFSERKEMPFVQQGKSTLEIKTKPLEKQERPLPQYRLATSPILFKPLARVPETPSNAGCLMLLFRNIIGSLQLWMFFSTFAPGSCQNTPQQSRKSLML